MFELLPEEYRVAFLLEMSPGMVSVFSTLLGSTADTCSASVHEAFLEEFHAFLREGRILRSESPQLQSIVVVDISVMVHRQIPMVVEFLQLQYIDKVVDVGCAGVVARPLCVQRQMPMVDVLMQFIDLGGRRCDAAATSSSCRPQQLE